MKEVSYKEVQKQSANAKVAKTLSVAVIGKTLKDAVKLLELNRVQYRIDDGNPSTMDEVQNRVNLVVSKDRVKSANLG